MKVKLLKIYRGGTKLLWDLFILLLPSYTNYFGVSTLLILIIVLELAVGGLGNLLAGEKIYPRYRWIAVKTSTQLILGTIAFYITTTNKFVALESLGVAAIFISFLLTFTYTFLTFRIHRRFYLKAF